MQIAERSKALDALRALAILLVIGAHTKGPDASELGVIRFAQGVWTRGGWTGVDLFFVLSGFLVSGLLFAEHKARGELRVGRFLLRRGLRIYPAFYAYVAFLVVASLLVGRAVTLERVLAEVFFVQNYFKPIWWGHTWSLAVEEHFYLLLPVALWVLARINRARGAAPFRGLVWLFVVVAVACLALRVNAAADAHGYSFFGNVYPTHLRIDSLLFGVVLAYLHHCHGERFAPVVRRFAPLFVVVGVALVAPAFFVRLKMPWMHTIGFTMLYVGYGAIVVAAVHAWPAATTSRWLGALAAIGQHSYSIYLWHRVVLVLAREKLVEVLGFRLPFVIEVSLMTAGAIGLGVLMSKLIEIPVLRARDRWFPTATNAPSTTAPTTQPTT